ncbi:GAG-pre-integrase domain-containing protein, partial [Solirubrobacter sp. CPCC 204708]|nr:GAG-pre-integrase domain-containing protein [Solirubrobacter deserti]
MPGIQHNLLSVIALINFGFSFEFSNNGLVIYADGILFGHGSFVDGFVKLNLNDSYYSSVNSASSYVIDSSNVNSTTWHARLGHIGRDRMTRLAREGLLGSLTKVDLDLCEPCLAGKACRKPFGK